MVALRDLPDGFQIEQLRATLQFVVRRSFALDIGAHRGIWSSVLASEFERVLAIEPNKESFDKIPEFKNLEKLNIACGEYNGRCSLREGEKNTGQTHVVEGNDVLVRPIDSLGVKPDFIKIDVEGMEFDVLKGAKKTIEECRPWILIEENGLCQRYGHKPDRATRLLRRWGMRQVVTFHMKPEKDVNILFGWPA